MKVMPPLSMAIRSSGLPAPLMRVTQAKICLVHSRTLPSLHISAMTCFTLRFVQSPHGPGRYRHGWFSFALLGGPHVTCAPSQQAQAQSDAATLTCKPEV